MRLFAYCCYASPHGNGRKCLTVYDENVRGYFLCTQSNKTFFFVFFVNARALNCDKSMNTHCRWTKTEILFLEISIVGCLYHPPDTKQRLYICTNKTQDLAFGVSYRQDGRGNWTWLSESRKVHLKVIHHSPQRRNSTYCLLDFVECVYLFVCVHKYHTANNNNSTKEKKENNPQNIILFLITRMNQYNKLKL